MSLLFSFFSPEKKKRPYEGHQPFFVTRPERSSSVPKQYSTPAAHCSALVSILPSTVPSLCLGRKSPRPFFACFFP